LSKIIILEDFLPEEQAEALAEVINSEDRLEYLYKTGEGDKPERIPGSSKFAPHRAEEEAKLKQSLAEGYFTYRQKRPLQHFKGCRCAYCCFVEDTLEDGEFAEFIGALGDIKDLELLKPFVSIYDTGDFLSTHPDPNYDVAFILNLTKDWKYEYGGCLTVLENDKPEVILPKFNSLVLMFLGDEGIEHYVSEVSRLAPHPRIAISGWYNRNSS
jgi:Rps23 Pro-64 3,4-dihydroxylase Tpa1-like proline 4-hydroxylase